MVVRVCDSVPVVWADIPWYLNLQVVSIAVVCAICFDY